MTDGRFLKKDQLTEEKISQIRALNEMAGQRGEKPSQMALKWVMKDPCGNQRSHRCVQTGADIDNLKMLDGASLSEEELLKIDQICGIKINRKNAQRRNYAYPLGVSRPCWQTISI